MSHPLPNKPLFWVQGSECRYRGWDVGSVKIPDLYLEGLTEDRSGSKELHPTHCGFQALQRLSSHWV